MKKKIELSLILPCYNEAEHFLKSSQLILDVLRKNRIAFELIFVEDASQDSTKLLVIEFLKRRTDKKYRVLFHKKNTGRGKSVADGIQEASGAFVGFMDIDCEVNPNYIPEFLAQLKSGSDVVCAERHYQTTTGGLIRALASKLYQQLVKTVLTTSLPDTEAGFKFFNRKRILPVLSKVHDTGWFWDTEIMIRSELAGLKIAFIPVQFKRRIDKTSTVRLIPDTLNYFIKLFSLWLNLRGNSLLKKI